MRLLALRLPKGRTGTEESQREEQVWISGVVPIVSRTKSCVLPQKTKMLSSEFCILRAVLGMGSAGSCWWQKLREQLKPGQVRGRWEWAP